MAYAVLAGAFVVLLVLDAYAFYKWGGARANTRMKAWLEAEAARKQGDERIRKERGAGRAAFERGLRQRQPGKPPSAS